MKITSAFTVFAAFWLSGCASYNQVMIGPGGTAATCDSSGQGLIGMAVASNSLDGCVQSRRAAGFIEVEKAGSFGFTPTDEGFVMQLVPNGPASEAGLKLGDKITAVNSVPVKSSKEILIILFGPFGQKVALTVQRGGATQEIAMVSKPWSEVNGVKSDAPEKSAAGYRYIP